MKNRTETCHHSHRSDPVSWLKCAWFVVSILFLNTTTLAQDHLYTFEFNEASLTSILNEIQDQTQISIIYNHEELSGADARTLSIEASTLGEVLQTVLQGTGLTYQKVNDTYVITPVPDNRDQVPGTRSSVLRGQVIDRGSRISLPFATVQLPDTEPVIGTTTDVDGYFRLEKLPAGRYTLKVSYVGYADTYVSEILLGSAKETVVTIRMNEQVHSLGEIVITETTYAPLNDLATVSAKSFSAEETKRYAASISDPARMVQSFPGVSGTDDASNEIVIRGNSPNWLLWRLEGVEIPNPNHFAEEGYSSGAVSVLSSNMLGMSDFYTGAFPAEYGNALSGVFDLNLRNGNNLKNEFVFQAGLLGVDLAAEGPFSTDYTGSFLFNYRYSTLFNPE